MDELGFSWMKNPKRAKGKLNKHPTSFILELDFPNLPKPSTLAVMLGVSL
jgi:hypothetical protein